MQNDAITRWVPRLVAIGIAAFLFALPGFFFPAGTAHSPGRGNEGVYPGCQSVVAHWIDAKEGTQDSSSFVRKWRAECDGQRRVMASIASALLGVAVGA